MNTARAPPAPPPRSSIPCAAPTRQRQGRPGRPGTGRAGGEEWGDVAGSTADMRGAFRSVHAQTWLRTELDLVDERLWGGDLARVPGQ
eukprot:scaffold6100_cov129-Isochrysis_galbana.AAC.5